MPGRATFATSADVRVTTTDIDTRLVAAVQVAAGARCHQAAGLLQAYYFAAERFNRARTAFGDEAAAADRARRLLLDAKVRLRDFLAAQLFGSINESLERRLDRDHASDNRGRTRPRAGRIAQFD